MAAAEAAAAAAAAQEEEEEGGSASGRYSARGGGCGEVELSEIVVVGSGGRESAGSRSNSIESALGWDGGGVSGTCEAEAGGLTLATFQLSQSRYFVLSPKLQKTTRLIHQKVLM